MLGTKSKSAIASILFLHSAISCNVLAGNEIYVTYAADRTPQFSSQPYDSSYTSYLREQAQPQPQHKRASTTRRYQITVPHPKIAALIEQSAREQGVDPNLVSAIIAVESGFNTEAVSPKGAVGAMQLIPTTAAHYGVTDLHDPQQNISGGTRYLKDLIVAYKGNLPLVLAAYNAGQTNVYRHNRRIPPFNETMLYVPRVLAKMEEYRRRNEVLSQ